MSRLIVMVRLAAVTAILTALAVGWPPDDAPKILVVVGVSAVVAWLGARIWTRWSDPPDRR